MTATSESDRYIVGNDKTLTARKTSATITIDGVDMENEWSKATAISIPVDQGQEGMTVVSLKALYNTTHVTFLAKWQDRTHHEDLTEHGWTLDDNATDPNGTWSSVPRDEEDRLVMMFSINDPGFNTSGCIELCHTDGMRTNNPGETTDVWHWKSSRSNPLNIAHDQYMDDGYDVNDIEAGHHGDGPSFYASNSNVSGTAPGYFEPNPVDTDDALVLLQSEIDSSDAIMMDGNASTLANNTIVPGRILNESLAVGDVADIQAKGKYSNGLWVLEMTRALDTSSVNDVIFNITKTFTFGVAVMDNGGGNPQHAYNTGVLTLQFEDVVDPTTTSSMVSANTLTAPVLDGTVDAAWDAATPMTVEASGGGAGHTFVNLSSLYDDDNIYFLAQWDDDTHTRSVWESGWLFVNPTDGWVRLSNIHPGLSSGEEDRIAFQWEMSDIANYDTAGCAVTCHTDGMRTNNDGEIADEWHWKASRSQPLGIAHDKWLDNSFDVNDVEAGHHGDGGEFYSHNDNASGAMPMYFEPNPDDATDAEVLLQSEIDNGEAVLVEGYGGTIANNTMVPGRTLNESVAVGDVADIKTGANYDNGVWTLEIKRKLDTISNNDVIFDPDSANDYLFGIAVFDDSGGSPQHSHSNGVLSLSFGPRILGTISGTVTDGTDPIVGASVDIYNAENNTEARSLTTDAAGLYSTDILPGNYVVRASASDFLTNSSIIETVTGQQTTTVDLELGASGNYSVKTLVAQMVTNVSTDSFDDTAKLTTLISGGKNGNIEVGLWAMYDNDELSIKAQWKDATKTTGYKMWKIGTDTIEQGYNDPHSSEDRIGFFWDIDSNAGCSSACHIPEMKTNSGTADVWHWKSARVDPAGYADDKYWDSTDRHGDTKDGGSYSDNVVEYLNPDWGTLFHNGTKVPMYTWNATTDPGYPDALFKENAVAIDWSNITSLSDLSVSQIPGITVQKPYMNDGSTAGRADVSASSSWQNGVWTVTMTRELDTGDPTQDYIFVPGTQKEFDMAVFDNGGHDHGHSYVFGLTLDWEMPITTGTLSGTVSDSAGPLSGASVDIYNGLNNTLVTGLTTDSDGSYSTEVQAGGYVVRASASDHLTESSTISSVTPGGTTTVDLTLDPSGNYTDKTLVAQQVSDVSTDSFDDTAKLTTLISGGKNGNIEVGLWAMYDNDELSIKAQWKDATKTTGYKMWKIGTDTIEQGHNDPHSSEDRIGFFWDIDSNAGCSSACHIPEMKTNSGTADVWHWKSARVDPAGYADDKYWDSTDRHGDTKDGGSYSDNVVEYLNPDWGTLFENGTKVPMYTWSATTDPGYPDALFKENAVTIDWSNITSLSDLGVSQIPGITVQKPYMDDGSTAGRADVSASSSWQNGVWTVTMTRELDTGDPTQDYIFVPGTQKEFDMAVFDNGGHDHGHSYVFGLSLDWERTSLTGTVKDTDSGAAISGATVSFQTELNMSTTTNATGQYTFEGLDPSMTYNVTVKANGYEDMTISENAVIAGEVNVLNISLKHLKANIAIGTPQLDKAKPKDGDKVTISAVVSNTGNMDATGVVVTFKDKDGKVIGTATVNVPSGGSTTASTEWKAKEGSQTITAEVTSPNAVSETATFKVKEKTAEGDNNFMMILIVIIIVLVVVALIAMSSKSKPESPVDEEEDEEDEEGDGEE